VSTNSDKPPVSAGSDSTPPAPRDLHPLRTALEIRLCVAVSDLVRLPAIALSRAALAVGLAVNDVVLWLNARALGLFALADDLLGDPALAGVTLLCVALVLACLALSVIRFV
jgi:hypothetical protein